MAVLVVLLLIAACFAGVIHNHRNAAEAMTGVEFVVDAPQRQVAAAITEIFCSGGAKSGLRSMITGVSVSPAGASSFTYKTKHGDIGKLVVTGSGSTATVKASTTELFVGNTEVFKNQRSRLHAAGVGLTHGICLLLNLTPNAAKMKRFARGLEPKLAKRIGHLPSSELTASV